MNRASSTLCPSIRHSYFVIRTSPGESLGWDVSNKAGLTEVYKPVIHEESIKACPELGRRVAGATKAPDYTFRIGRRRVFFAEAKKPAVRIADDASPAFQLRRYAWGKRGGKRGGKEGHFPYSCESEACQCSAGYKEETFGSKGARGREFRGRGLSQSAARRSHGTSYIVLRSSFISCREDDRRCTSRPSQRLTADG